MNYLKNQYRSTLTTESTEGGLEIKIVATKKESELFDVVDRFYAMKNRRSLFKNRHPSLVAILGKVGCGER
jgi:hypothetical protein